MKSETPDRKKTIKKYAVNIGVALLSILLCCIVAECIIRLLKKDTMVLYPRYHTDVQYGEYKIRRLRPNLEYWHTSVEGSWKFTTNKQGYRSNYDFSYDKPPGVVRVIALGDSHTQGFEVRQDYTFSAIVEKYLSNNGYKAQVFNMGISGFGTAEELVLLENEGIKYKPDYIILGFCPNDFDDSVKAGLFELDNGELKVKNKEHLPGVRIQNLIYKLPFTHFLGENSYFYSLLFNTTWDYYKKLLYSKAKEQVLTEYVIPTEEATDYGTELTSRLIERMYSSCKKNNIKLIIFGIPWFYPEGIKPPWPDDMHETIIANCDVFVDSGKVLEDYNNLVALCKEHGHHHISEFTHCLLGVEIAKEIISEETSP
jgi:hypothetical protein